MSTLVEMIEALQSEWRKTSQIPNCNSFEEGYAKAHEWLARELAPILAAAREQEQELAAMKEPMECTHPKAFWIEPNYATMTVCTEMVMHPEKYPMPQGYCSLCRQHSADLRAVAEMAIEAVGKYMDDFRKWDEDIDSLPESVPIFPTAASILREFREKQQKAVTHSTTCSKQANGIQCTCGAEKKAKVGK